MKTRSDHTFLIPVPILSTDSLNTVATSKHHCYMDDSTAPLHHILCSRGCTRASVLVYVAATLKVWAVHISSV